MTWVGRFVFAVVSISFIELVLLIWVSEQTSFLFALAGCILTGLLGGWLVRRQGLMTWLTVQKQLSMGKIPTAEITAGLLILIAAAFLLTPGFVTDLVGFLLLVPKFRLNLSGALLIRLKQRRSGEPSSNATIIDIPEEDVTISSPSRNP